MTIEKNTTRSARSRDVEFLGVGYIGEPEPPEYGNGFTPRVWLSPSLDQFMREVPACIARSGLFALDPPTKPKIHAGTVFHQTDTVTLRGWGNQLSEDSADIWLRVLHLAATLPFSEPVVIREAELLRDLGRDASSREWLHAGILALLAFTIVIEARTGGMGCRLSLLDGSDYDEATQTFRFWIAPRSRETFCRADAAPWVDLERRRMIRHDCQLARSLQRLVCASQAIEQRCPLQFLKERSQFREGWPVFKHDLREALRELERVGLVTDARIELGARGTEQAVWRKLLADGERRT